MKRQSAQTTATGRCETAAGEAETSSLPLSPEELEEIRAAYRDGCSGEIVIGMRGEERVITMLVPAPGSCDLAKKLVGLGCDRFIRVQKAVRRGRD